MNLCEKCLYCFLSPNIHRPTVFNFSLNEHFANVLSKHFRFFSAVAAIGKICRAKKQSLNIGFSYRFFHGGDALPKSWGSPYFSFPPRRHPHFFCHI